MKFFELCVYGGLTAILIISTFFIFPLVKNNPEYPTRVWIHGSGEAEIFEGANLINSISEHITISYIDTRTANLTYSYEFVKITKLEISQLQFYYIENGWVEISNYNLILNENGSFHILAKLPDIHTKQLSFLGVIILFCLFIILFSYWLHKETFS